MTPQTTIMAMRCQDGVVLGADSRTSMGTEADDIIMMSTDEAFQFTV